jgi:hypothetical protein
LRLRGQKRWRDESDDIIGTVSTKLNSRPVLHLGMRSEIYIHVSCMHASAAAMKLASLWTQGIVRAERQLQVLQKDQF